jgi:hypothetical protein
MDLEDAGCRLGGCCELMDVAMRTKKQEGSEAAAPRNAMRTRPALNVRRSVERRVPEGSDRARSQGVGAIRSALEEPSVRLARGEMQPGHFALPELVDDLAQGCVVEVAQIPSGEVEAMPGKRCR